MNDIDFRDMLSSMTAYHIGTLSEAERCANAITQLLEVMQKLYSTNPYGYIEIKEQLLSKWVESFADDSAKSQKLYRQICISDYAFMGYPSPRKYWKHIKNNVTEELL